MKKQAVLIFVLFIIGYTSVKSQKLVMDNFFDKFTYRSINDYMREQKILNERTNLQTFFYWVNNLSYSLYSKEKGYQGFDYCIKYDDSLFKGVKTRSEYYSFKNRKENIRQELYKINNYDRYGVLYKKYEYYNPDLIEYIYDSAGVKSIWNYKKRSKNVETYLREYDALTKTTKIMRFYRRGDTLSVNIKTNISPYTNINYTKSKRGKLKSYSFSKEDSVSYSKNRRGKLKYYSFSKLDDQNRKMKYSYRNNHSRFNTLDIDGKTQWIREYKRCKKDTIMKEYTIFTYNDQGQNDKIINYKKNGKIIKETLFDCNPLGENSKDVLKENICKNTISNANGTFYTIYFEETNKKKQNFINKTIAVYNADSTLQQIKSYTRDNKLYDSLYVDATHLFIKMYSRRKVYTEVIMHFNNERILKMAIQRIKKERHTTSKRDIMYFYDDNSLVSKIVDNGYYCCKKKKKNRILTTMFVNDYY
ncbi:MAG: hypothetical protein A2X12_04325 [Bacteroidetes bacterium GWE2_29_8]|nr:MAG: hypothetical protein A2X12_04325 [Bacteroidetes bacterium GWE2_29_8]OFY16163.1 MAG: hypothetical protein A2X02_10165 [Bacteroidetes bacterium GWF2_29_10]